MTAHEPETPSQEETPTPGAESLALAGPPEDPAEYAQWRVGLWWPRGLPRTADEPAAVSFTRAAVAAAAPRTPNEASAALGHCYRYALWMLSRAGGALDLAAVFTPEAVGTYIDEVFADAPKGTRMATSSVLRRLAPGVGLAALCPAAQSRRPKRRRAVELDPAVVAVIEAYVPTTLHQSRFERIAPLVREAVTTYGPATAERARDLVRFISYYCVWADAHNRPLRPDAMFDPEVIEEFAHELKTRAKLDPAINRTSVATWVAALRSVSAAVRGEAGRVEKVSFGRADLTSPYSALEIDQAIVFSRRMQTSQGRRFTSALIALGLAAGPSGPEVDLARPGDISHDGGGSVFVTLHGADGSERSVRAVGVYAELLVAAAAAARAAGDSYLLGGTTRKGRNSRVCALAKDWPFALTLSRLQGAHRVALALEGRSLPELLSAAGVVTLQVFDSLLPWIMAGAEEEPWMATAAESGGAA